MCNCALTHRDTVYSGHGKQPDASKEHVVREGFTEKVAVLLDFVRMRGRKGPAQIFFHLFINAFLVN